MKVLILLPNPPTPYNPSFARAYYLIKFNRSYDIKVLALCRYECEIPSEISSNYKIKLIKIPKLSSSNTVNGLNSVISRFTARNLSLSKDWNIFDRIYFPSMQDNILNLCAVENFDVIYAHRSLCSYLYILRKKYPLFLISPLLNYMRLRRSTSMKIQSQRRFLLCSNVFPFDKMRKHGESLVQESSSPEDL